MRRGLSMRVQEVAEILFRGSARFPERLVGVFSFIGMKSKAGKYLELFKTAAVDWMNDHAPRLGAALAFYTIFSLAPLITILVSIAGLWFSENANQQMFAEIGRVMGEENAAKMQELLAQPGSKSSGIFATVSAGVMLLFGATAVFVQLQDSLNEIWEVKAKPGQGIMGFIRNRLLSLGAVLAIGFLLLVSLVLSTFISAIGNMMGGWIGDMGWLWQTINLIVSFAIITVLFAFMFKYLPDAEVAWKDVWFGAAFTSILFAVGKFALGWYLGKNSLASTYAAAGSLIVVLLWVYYSAQILFFGAEITQAYAAMKGREVVPSEHAQWDAEKRCKTKAANEKREEKKKIKTGETLSPGLAPAYAGSAPGPVSGSSRKGIKKAAGLALLAVALAPIEKKLFPNRH